MMSARVLRDGALDGSSRPVPSFEEPTEPAAHIPVVGSVYLL